jgi:hypothetical protein
MAALESELLGKNNKMAIPRIVGIWRMPAERKIPGIDVDGRLRQ